MRRPFHVLTCLGTATHHLFELGAGVGLVFQPWLGLWGAGCLWGITLPAWVAATQASRRWDRPLALAAGMALGGTALHYAMWPWELRHGLPWLTEAEGLRPEHLGVYNAILLSWGAVSLAALAGSPGGTRRWGLLGLTAALPLHGSARRHFVWIRDRARTEPSWWNRAFAPPAELR